MAEVGEVREVAEFGCSLTLFRDMSKLRTWFVGVLQIKHYCCKQGEFLVHVF